MELTKEMLRHLAKLSRLDEGAAMGMENDLNRILEDMKILESIDISGVDLLTVKEAVSLRPDMVKPSFDRELLLSCAPETDGEGYFVPKAVE